MVNCLGTGANTNLVQSPKSTTTFFKTVRTISLPSLMLPYLLKYIPITTIAQTSWEPM